MHTNIGRKQNNRDRFISTRTNLEYSEKLDLLDEILETNTKAYAEKMSDDEGGPIPQQIELSDAQKDIDLSFRINFLVLTINSLFINWEALRTFSMVIHMSKNLAFCKITMQQP